MLVCWFRCLSWIRSSDWLRSLRSIRPSGLPTSFKKFAGRCKASAAIRQIRFNEESERWSAPSRTPWSPNMKAFPDAMVTEYEGLIPVMKNDPKDRHVRAAAVKCGAHSIVSDNVKHFPTEALSPYNMECLTADDFRRHQYPSTQSPSSVSWWSRRAISDGR